MDLESMRRCWRDVPDASTLQLEEEPVMRMLAERTVDLQREVRRRLRREAGYYVPIVAVSAMSLVGGLTLNRMLAVGTVVVMIGGVIATLWWAERRIEETPLDGSLRQALIELRSELDAAGRAYVTVYVALFIVSAFILVGAVWWRNGAGQLFAGALVLSVLSVLWSHRSGRGYVDRMFHRYRTDLSECLNQLEEP